MKPRGSALAWFRKGDWTRWCEIDPDFQRDYDHWLRRAEALVQRKQRAGEPIVKVLIDPEDYLVWRAAAGREIDTEGDARSAFAAMLAAQQDRGK